MNSDDCPPHGIPRPVDPLDASRGCLYGMLLGGLAWALIWWAVTS